MTDKIVQLIGSIKMGDGGNQNERLYALPEDLKGFHVDYGKDSWKSGELSTYAANTGFKLSQECQQKIQSNAAFTNRLFFFEFWSSADGSAKILHQCVTQCESDEDIYSVLRKHLGSGASYAGITKVV